MANEMVEIRVDSLVPHEMALKAENIGLKKAGLDFPSMFMLAILAGAFIAMGAVFSTTVGAGGITVKAPDGTITATFIMPFGLMRLVTGLTFTVGLILVMVAGAELFTGNTLIIMAWASKKVSTTSLLRNWAIVYAGNFAGSLITATLLFQAGQYTQGSGAVGLNALRIAQGKVGYGFLQALLLGIFCNALVCMAVWLCFSARTTTDRILAILSPITAFVAAGFEHSIANMYFIPVALLIKEGAPASFWAAAGSSPGQFANLTWYSFLVGNLLPVTIGNIIGGSLMVGATYWCIYLRPRQTANPVPAPHQGTRHPGDHADAPAQIGAQMAVQIHV
jgi:formate transporter